MSQHDRVSVLVIKIEKYDQKLSKVTLGVILKISINR